MTLSLTLPTPVFRLTLQYVVDAAWVGVGVGVEDGGGAGVVKGTYEEKERAIDVKM